MIRRFFQVIEDWIDEDIDNLYGVAKATFAFITMCGLVLGLVVFVINLISGPDQTISLDKRDWHCTATRTELVPVLVGKIFIPEPQEVCTTWVKNQ